MSTPHLLGALMASLLIGWVAIGFFKISLGNVTGSGGGRFLLYSMIGVICFVGWIFARFVPKERFLVTACTRCAHKVEEKIIE